MPTATVDIELVGGGDTPVDYELVHEKLFDPEASSYVGEAEVCTMFFDAPPEQIPALETIVIAVTEAVVSNIIANDGFMLRLRIWRATGEWYNSKWKVEAVIHASPFPWAIVVPLIIGLLIVIGFAFITYQVGKMDWGGKAVVGGLGLVLLLVVAMLAFGGGKKEKEAT